MTQNTEDLRAAISRSRANAVRWRCPAPLKEGKRLGNAPRKPHGPDDSVLRLKSGRQTLRFQVDLCGPSERSRFVEPAFR